ncbi:hypothetical protein [Brevibacillus laterosporus]|uniref:hypothetical protein n=1 Tax=Brevibacillus laterosporus TaxID=1465 RepID=UPI001A7E294D|nr:hypothetical protein [Brevibacillus laterosporus]
MYDAKGHILAAAPLESPKQPNLAGYLRPVPNMGQKVTEIEVGDEFSDLAYLAKRCGNMYVDTTGPEPVLRAISDYIGVK